MSDEANTPDPNWPAWFYGPDGAAQIFQSEAEVPNGWVDHPAKVVESKPEPTLLDSNVETVIAALADLSAEELEQLKADETAGKSRKTVLAAIEEAITAKAA